MTDTTSALRPLVAPAPGVPAGLTETVLHKALLIRRAEERLLELFAEGELSGTVHSCIGQELVGATVSEFLRHGDTVFSNHRCHGHYIGFTGDLVGLFAEVMGRRSGASRGLGGSQHLHRDGFWSGGILGGLLPVAAGSAMGHDLAGTDRIAVAFVGDGAFGEGVVYETLNLAALWRLPVLFVVEDNHIAQSTASSQTRAGRLDRRAEAFGIPVDGVDCWNPGQLAATTEHAVAAVRAGDGPRVLLVETYRLAPHSKGDDLRDPAEIVAYRSRDVVQGLLDGADPLVRDADRRASAEVAAAVAAARASDALDAGDVLPAPRAAGEPVSTEPVAPDGRRFVGALRDGLGCLLAEDPRLLLLGEDIEDPYGGAFKVTRGLSTAHPGRVRNTPISEAAIVGAGTGLATGGHRAIVEIMFGDFLTLAVDQLVNQAAKLRSVYGAVGDGQLVVRTPMGGYRGYGPTHSQSLERHLFGVPGLRVVALNRMVDPLPVYRALLTDGGDPAVVLENKLLYGTRVGPDCPAGFHARRGTDALPVVHVAPDGVPDVTLLGYGGMLDPMLAAADRLFAEHEVLAQVLCTTKVHPFDVRDVLAVLGRTAVVVVEEGQGFAGFGAEVLAQLCEHAPGRASGVGRVHAAAIAIPACPSLEQAVLPSVTSVVEAALEAVRAG